MRKDQTLLVATAARVIPETARRLWLETTRRLWPLASLALAACATTPPPQKPPAPPPPPPPHGLSRLLGAGVPTVIALLGAPSRDAREGPARLLQFVRPPCILDVYLYPGPGGAPQVRTAAARRGDGSAIDPAACLTLIAPPAAN